MRAPRTEQALLFLAVLAFCLAAWALVGLGLYGAWSIAR